MRRKGVVRRRLEWRLAGWIVTLILLPILIPFWILRWILREIF